MGLCTQPCGTPVFIVIVLVLWFPILTDWDLHDRRFRTQLQREGGWHTRGGKLAEEPGWFHNVEH